MKGYKTRWNHLVRWLQTWVPIQPFVEEFYSIMIHSKVIHHSFSSCYFLLTDVQLLSLLKTFAQTGESGDPNTDFIRFCGAKNSSLTGEETHSWWQLHLHQSFSIVHQVTHFDLLPVLLGATSVRLRCVDSSGRFLSSWGVVPSQKRHVTDLHGSLFATAPVCLPSSFSSTLHWSLSQRKLHFVTSSILSTYIHIYREDHLWTVDSCLVRDIFFCNLYTEGANCCVWNCKSFWDACMSIQAGMERGQKEHGNKGLWCFFFRTVW